MHLFTLRVFPMNATTQTPRRFQQGLQRLLQSRVAGVLSYPHGVDRYLEVLNPLWSTTASVHGWRRLNT